MKTPTPSTIPLSHLGPALGLIGPSRVKGDDTTNRVGRERSCPAGQEGRAFHHRVIDAGEYGLALEDITGILAYDRAPVTDQERDDIVTLSRTMHMDDLIVDKLRSCPRPG